MERLFEVCKSVWQLLTESEREAFVYDTGTIGFVEQCAELIHFDLNTITEKQFDEILEVLE